MKKALFLPLLLVLNLNLFSQAAFPNADSVVNYLKGNWTWVRSCGGIFGGCITPTTYPEGPQSAVFTKVPGSNDSIDYVFYKNAKPQNAGRSKVTCTSAIYGNAWTFDVLYTGMVSIQFSVHKSKTDSVWFNEICFECIQRSYVRNTNTVRISGQQPLARLGVFPNPVTSELTLMIEPSNALSLHLFDATGRQLAAPELVNGRISVTHLPRGIYFLQLTTPQGSARTSFVKE